MNTDKNTVIGFILLAGLFFTYFWYTNKQQTDLTAYKKHFDDSVMMLKAEAAKAAATKNPIISDTSKQAGSIAAVIADSVKEQFTELENELVKVKFSNKGGQVVGVTLKKYSNNQKQLVQLGDSSSLNYSVNIGDNKTAQVNKVLFTTVNVLPNKSGIQQLEYVWATPNGKVIRHLFSLAPNKYNVDWSIQLQGASTLFTNQQVNFLWDVHAVCYR